MIIKPKKQDTVAKTKLSEIYFELLVKDIKYKLKKVNDNGK